MNLLQRALVCVLFITLATSIHIDAQEQSLLRFEQELTRLEIALTALKESAKSQPAVRKPNDQPVTSVEPASRRDLLQAMLRELIRIDTALPPTWPGEETYAAAFRGYADMVEAIAHTDPILSDDDQLQALRDLYIQLDELRVALYSRQGLESKQLRGPTVAVTIKTISNGHEVKGLQVRCTPFALRNVQPELHVFKQLTTTGGELLMPGKYYFRIFWNNKLLSAATYAVGINGELSELIEFAIPERK